MTKTFQKLLINVLSLFLFFSISCAGQRYSFSPIPTSHLSAMNDNLGSSDPDHVDKEFEVKDDDGKESFDTKISYVLLGLVIAAASAAAIAVPIILANN